MLSSKHKIGDCNLWDNVMLEEMELLHKNSIWELDPKLKDWKIIGSKLVYRKKESINKNEAPTYKAKLVAKEFSKKRKLTTMKISLH